MAANSMAYSKMWIAVPCQKLSIPTSIHRRAVVSVLLSEEALTNQILIPKQEGLELHRVIKANSWRQVSRLSPPADSQAPNRIQNKDFSVKVAKWWQPIQLWAVCRLLGWIKLNLKSFRTMITICSECTRKLSICSSPASLSENLKTWTSSKKTICESGRKESQQELIDREQSAWLTVFHHLSLIMTKRKPLEEQVTRVKTSSSKTLKISRSLTFLTRRTPRCSKLRHYRDWATMRRHLSLQMPSQMPALWCHLSSVKLVDPRQSSTWTKVDSKRKLWETLLTIRARFWWLKFK